jgi:RND family efflux transporter MFP subunit
MIMKKSLYLASLVLMLLLCATGCDLMPTAEEPEENVVSNPITETGVIAEANLVPVKYSALRFAMPGLVDEVAVSEGEAVEEGQLLARLGNIEPLEAQLLAADLAVLEAEQQLEELEKYRTDEDALELAEAALDLAKGQQRAARKAIEDSKLKAPFDAKVMRIELEEGVYISPAELAMVLADTSSWYLETFDLDENEVVRISEGEQVEIVFDALPGREFSGEVESISEYFLESFGNITYVVRIKLAETDDQLRWGMTAEVTFIN